MKPETESQWEAREGRKKRVRIEVGDRSKIGHQDLLRFLLASAFPFLCASRVAASSSSISLPLAIKARRMRFPGNENNRRESGLRRCVIEARRSWSRKRQSIDSSPEPTMATCGLSIRIVAWSMRSCSVSGRCVYILGKRERRNGQERGYGGKKGKRGRLLF